MPCRVCDDGEPWVSLQTAFSALCDAAELGCPFCSIIKNGIVLFANGDDITNISVSHLIEMRRESQLGQQRPLCVDFDNRVGDKTTLEFYTADASAEKLCPHFPIAAHISADSFSPGCLSQARRWLDHCIENHTSHRCPPATGSPLPTRVICVGDDSTDPYLHESTTEEKAVWAALSYCWGKTRTLTTTIASISERKAGFALDAVPKTCRDAILFARALSIPYIWIDSLCIIQDSSEDWEKEAARMCYTYENAIVTFAALDSPSSDTGLFLSGPYRRTVKLDTCINGQAAVVYARRQNNVGILGFMHGHSQDSIRLSEKSEILETRGWTLQEILLSPRVLWFSSSELGWSCWSNTACECDPEQTSEFINNNTDYIKISSSPSLIKTDITDLLATWRTLVNSYTERSLTVQTDRLAAISGLASALRTHLNSSYLAGLWEFDLAKELMWASSWSAFGSDLSLPSIEDGYAPSWSWASVSGAVRFVPEAQRPRFHLVWQIHSVQFRRLGLDPFGRGEGSIAIEGHLLPLRWASETLVWFSPADNEDCIKPVLFCADHEILMDPRAGNRDRRAMAQKRLFFLVAGLLMPNLKSVEPNVPLLCNGLLLEALPGERTFARVGFAESHFDKLELKEEWPVWETRCARMKIQLV